MVNDNPAIPPKGIKAKLDGFVSNFKALPIESKRLLSLGLVLALVFALPVLILTIISTRTYYFNRAATGETIEPPYTPMPIPTITPTLRPSIKPTFSPTPTPYPSIRPTVTPTPRPTSTSLPTPWPTPSVRPSPTPPAPIGKISIITTQLPTGRIGRQYFASVMGTSTNRYAKLVMSAKGLPRGLALGGCSTTNTSVLIIRCGITGMPQKLGIYPINVYLSDNFGQIISKTLYLFITPFKIW